MAVCCILSFRWFGCHVIAIYLRGNISDLLWDKIHKVSTSLAFSLFPLDVNKILSYSEYSE